MATVYTPNAVLGDGVAVMGPFRVAFGTVEANGTTATFTVGLDTISALQITGSSAGTASNQNNAFSGDTITLKSCSSGDVFNVFAIGR